MGQDIHTKTIVYSKIEDRYIDSCELCERNSVYSEIPELYAGRYYDLFALFGSSRSNYPELDDITYGIPECAPKTFKAYMDKYGADYHTFSWFTISTLESSLRYYIEKLKCPSKFIVEGNAQSSIFNIEEWTDSNTQLIKTVERILDRIVDIRQDTEYIKDLIDVDKTIFMFWFDN